jgi:acetyl-CoA synthetase
MALKKKKKTKVKKKVIKKVTKKTKVKKKVIKKVTKKTKVKKKVIKKVTKKTKVKKKVIKKVTKKTKVKKKIVSKIFNGNPKELIIKTKPQWVKNSLASKAKYKDKYLKSIRNNDEFWRKEGKRITWIKPYSKIKDVKYSSKEVKIKWFEDGTLNASANCIDRHLKDKKDKTAIIWVGDDPKDSQKISYKQLHEKVSKAANGLKKLGVKKGDRVTIYLTMIPELAILMLACVRIGAVHSIIFGGFSADSISGRVNDCESEYIITADEGVRGGKTIPLKYTVDEALESCPNVKKCIVVKRTENYINWDQKRDVWYHDLIKDVSNHCEPEEMSAEDPLFILYTSGSTGKPKGVLHTTGGYMVYASMTHQYIFNYKPKDIYWCTADIGWVTGHSYIIYGPLANGATTIMFEGIPNYPTTSRWWQIIDKYKVNTFYTAPTAIRALMREGDKPVKKTSRKSLKLLGTVGEPINPEAWMWYYKTVGNSRCPIVDTWWQTETGGIMIAPQTGAIDLKPGSATKPFYGIKPVLVDKKGAEIKGAGEGRLCIAQSWPGQMRTVYGDHQRFIDTYFSQFDGKYFTGDGCRRDKDGYYWITGRVDDVIIVSGHNLGTAEIESAFVAHPKVAEAAVVGYPHDIKGNGLYCYVTLNVGERETGDLERDLKLWVRKQIGPLATPDLIHFTPGLPKTRSGKIMRRILRKIAHNEHGQLGDTTTLADPSVVDSLVNNRKNI